MVKNILKNKNKSLKLTTLGFTLIELLAVIIILVIIALIAIPVVLNIIEKSKKEAFKDSAYSIIKAGELYYSSKSLEIEEMKEDTVFTFPEGTGLEIKGTKPTSGNIKITKEGKIELAVSNGKWCARKSLKETEVKISKDLSNCNISSDQTNNILSSMKIELELGGTVTLTDASQTNIKYTSLDENIAIIKDGKIKGVGKGTTIIILDINGNKTEIPVIVKGQLLFSINDCIYSNTKCSNGTKVSVQVGDQENYDFYVIDDTGSELTLIMSKNLGDNVLWINNADYKAAGGSVWNSTHGNNEKGPLTALKALEDRAKNWDNIKTFDYTLEDDKPDIYDSKYDSTNVNYEPIKITNARARFLTSMEAKKLGCVYGRGGSCPEWLSDYTDNNPNNSLPSGYWLSTATWTSSSPKYNVYYINYHAQVGSTGTTSTGYGIRPVIKISKNI